MRIGAIRNAESARVSIVGQLKKVALTSEPTEVDVLVGSQSHEIMNTEIAEEDEYNEISSDTKQSDVESHEFSTPDSVEFNFKNLEKKFKFFF